MSTTKKQPAKKATTKINPKTGTITVEKAETKTVAKAPVKKESNLNVISELSKIGAAYTAALNGKMKFSEVKEMFKKLHKEVKKSSKK